jgi:hypothetical protein
MASPPRVGGQGWLARAVVANRPEADTQGSLPLKSSLQTRVASEQRLRLEAVTTSGFSLKV